MIDNTISAVTHAIKEITKEEADDYFVVVISDANIHQYNISPFMIATALQADLRVNAHIIFIGSLSDQAERLTEGLRGTAHICLNNTQLPRILKSIFVASLMK